MGLWFFLTVVVVGHLALKAYKMRILQNRNESLNRFSALEGELKDLREKVHQLDEVVFFGDFDLKRQFKSIEREMSTGKKSSHF